MRLLVFALLCCTAAPAFAEELSSEPTILPQPQRGAPSPIGLRVGRVALEVVLGAGMAAPAIVSGAYIGVTFDLLGGRDTGPGFSIGTALGAALGTAPGVWLAGYAMGGDGAFGWTLLGSTAGTAISAGLLAINSGPAMLAISALFPIAGAIVGYELSSHTRRPPKSGPMIVPTVGPSSLGVAGVF